MPFLVIFFEPPETLKLRRFLYMLKTYSSLSQHSIISSDFSNNVGPFLPASNEEEGLKNQSFTWTLYRGDEQPLSKRYEFADGKIIKFPAFPLSSGSATLKKARTLRGFATFLDNLDEFSAIGSGIPKLIANKKGNTSINLLPAKTVKDFDPNTHTSRTRKDFIFLAGCGVLWLDFDEMPN